MGALTKKEWLASLQKMIDEFDWEGEGQPVAIGWYIEGYGAVLGAVRPNLRYEEWRPFYAIRTPPQRKPLPKGEWPKHPSGYVGDVYKGYDKSDLDNYAMQVLAAHGIKE